MTIQDSGSLLAVLRRIVQEVSNLEDDFPEALSVLVKRVRQAIGSQAASLFLADYQRHEYVLAATDGLNQACIGKVRIPLPQGLIGLIGQREELINLEDAQTHPCFFSAPDLGEQALHACLGAPMIYCRRLLGVILVQQEEKRCFDESDEAFLVTLSTQLAGSLAHAEATGAVAQLLASYRLPAYPKHVEEEVLCLRGVAASPGIGIGTAVVVYPRADLEAVPDLITEDKVQEHVLLDRAIWQAQQDMLALSERMQHVLPPSEHALFDVYLKMLEDDNLSDQVRHIIDTQSLTAEAALKKVIKQHVAQFEALEDPYIRERASDFKDIGRRVLTHLQAQEALVYDYPRETILVGDEIAASDLIDVPEGQLWGLVCSQGSATSHVAVLAKALGIPTVMGARGAALHTLDSETLIVDGYLGHIYVNPSPRLLCEFNALLEEENQLEQRLESLRYQAAETLDGHRIQACINTGIVGHSSLSLSAGSDGVGLYRTEMAFLVRDRFPAEEEQRVVYRQLLKAFAPKPVVMRVLDIGGDKNLPYFPIEEENPFLGWRGIRVVLDHPDVFLIQIKAMLSANQGLNNLRVLLPMISNLTEVDDALYLIDQAYRELKGEGLISEKPPIGVMIEVPSAVYQVRSIAKRVDFLSVGSNDLTQYMLAVDRNNPKVAGLYNYLHPAVLHALHHVVTEGHQAQKQVGVCGEMPSDPVAAILLLAMGFDSLSVHPTSLLRIKWVIRQFTLGQAKRLLEDVLSMDNHALIRFHVEKALESAGVGNLLRMGRH